MLFCSKANRAVTVTEVPWSAIEITGTTYQSIVTSVLVSEPAACVRRPADIDSGAALLNKHDLPLLIDHEAGAIGESTIGYQDTISLDSLTRHEIAEKGKT